MATDQGKQNSKSNFWRERSFFIKWAIAVAAGLVGIARLFITENETNFLAFPDVPNSVAIFGAGYGWDALAAAQWLRRCTVFYWGDIDPHGFAILDQLRGRFEHVESLLMDRATLLAHEAVSRGRLGR